MVVHDAERIDRARRRIADSADAADVASLTEILCEPPRLRIVAALGSEELSVGDLAAAIDRKVPATSQHLRVLREHGVVERRRRARVAYYRLRPGLTSELVLQLLKSLADAAGPGTP